MGKRKEAEFATKASVTKRKKKLLEENPKNEIMSQDFDFVEFTKVLQDESLSLKGLQNFCKFNRLYLKSASATDVVKKILSLSPQLTEIFKCLEQTSISSAKLPLLFEILAIILMRICDDMSSFLSVGISITKRILQKHATILYNALSIRNSSEVIVPTLRMLTAMVMQDGKCAEDVATILDLSGNVFKALARYQPDVEDDYRKKSSNVRLCVVRLVLSFCVYGNTKTIIHVLEARGFVDAIFRGLTKDSSTVVSLFLSTILETVIKQTLIPKTNKIKLLAGHGVLGSVAELLECGDISPVSLEQVKETMMVPHGGKHGFFKVPCTEKLDFAIPKLAYQFLYESCCSLKYGIVFHDNEFGTASRSCNHVILRFLCNLKSASNNAYCHILVVNILQVCPGLLKSFLHSASLSFNPRSTEQWFKNCHLVQDIYSYQPSVTSALTEASKMYSLTSQETFTSTKLIGMITPGILPVVFQRANMKSTIAHSDHKVKAVGLDILIGSLDRLKSSIAYLMEDSYWSKSVYRKEDRVSVIADLKLEMRKQLPDIKTLLVTWRSIPKDAEQVRNILEQVLKALTLYQEIFPNAFEKCGFDFSLLLQDLNIDWQTPLDSKILLYLLDILLPSVFKYRWFKKDGSKKTLFQRLVYIIMQSTTNNFDRDDSLYNKAVQLVFEVATMNMVVEKSAQDELNIWIYCLSQSVSKLASCTSTEEDRDFLLQFFERSVCSVAKRPHRYFEKMMMIVEKLNNLSEEDLTKKSEILGQVLNVDIGRIGLLSNQVNSPCQGETEVNPNKSKVDLKISLLLIASIEELSSLLLGNISDKQLHLLDLMLNSVISGLVHSQIFCSSSKIFNQVTLILLSEVQLLKLPSLYKLYEHLIHWELIELQLGGTIDDSLNGTMHCKKYPSSSFLPKHNVPVLAKTAIFNLPYSGKAQSEKEKIQAGMKDLSDSIQDINFDLSISSIQWWRNKNCLAEWLYYITKAVNLFKICCSQDDTKDVKKKLIKISLKLSTLLFGYVVKLQEVVAQHSDCEVKRNRNETETISGENDTINYCSSQTANSSHILENDFLSKRTLLDVVVKIINTDVLKNLFLSHDVSHPEEVIVYLDDCLVNLVSVCCTWSEKIPVYQYYLNKLALSICEDLKADKFVIVSPKSVDYFLKLYIHFESGSLLKILEVALQRCVRQHDSSVDSIISRCVAQLIKRTEGDDARVLPDKIIITLLQILINRNETMGSVLEIILELFNTNLCYIKLAETNLIDWCFENLNNEKAIMLLSIVVSYNEVLRNFLINAFCDHHHKYCLENLATSVKRQLVATVISVLTYSEEQLSSHDYLKRFLSAVEKSYWNMLSDVLITSPASLYQSDAKLLVFILDYGSISEECIKIFRSQLCGLLEDEHKFMERSMIARALLKRFIRKGVILETKTLCWQLICSVMTLSCKIMNNLSLHQEESCNLLMISSTLNDLLREQLEPPTSLNALPTKWNAFVKKALKCQFTNKVMLELMAKFVKIFYGKDITSDFLKINILLDMIKSHSSYLSVLLEENPKNTSVKSSLGRLLYELIKRCDAEYLQQRDFLPLLAAYGGTLSVCDQYLYQIILQYEAKGLSMKECAPFLWGKTVLGAIRSFKNVQEILHIKTSPDKVFDCLDEDLMRNTLIHFPIRRRMSTFENFFDNASLSFCDDIGRSDERIEMRHLYDPCFLLSVVAHLLSPTHFVDCRKFSKQDVLAFLFVCLSSHCKYIRNLASTCIARYYEHAEASRFSENNLIRYSIRCAQNALYVDKHGSVKKISSVVAVYLSKLIQLTFQPSEHMFSVMYRFLLVKPELDITAVPEFYATFFSSEGEFKTERAWILDLLRTGLRDMSDYYTVERRQLFRILMSFCESPTSDNYTRKQVFQVIEQACLIRGAVFDLINKQALVPWMINMTLIHKKKLTIHDGGDVCVRRQDSTIHLASVLQTLWKTLDTCDEYHTSKEKVSFRVVPKYVARDVVSLCFDLMTNLLVSCNTSDGERDCFSNRIEKEMVGTFMAILHIVVKAMPKAFIVAVQPVGISPYRRWLSILQDVLALLLCSIENISEELASLIEQVETLFGINIPLHLKTIHNGHA